MKNYKVNVNGTEYIISIELMSDEEAAKAKEAVKASPAAQDAQNAPMNASGEGAEIKAPIQGTILSVNVTAGTAVKKGDVLFILEAMKMENEIMAPNDGTVTSVSVANGASVANGTVLCTIK